MSRIDRKSFFYVLLIAMIVVMPLSIVILNYYQGNIRMGKYTFTESARELRNPSRGFYNLYRFMITDDKVNYWQLVQEMYENDQRTTLSLVEINLQHYREGEISEAGLANVELLFQALGELDKQLIVRFMYDWDGENEKYEPETIDVILMHMEQLEEILHKPDREIFILQGLFVGNWGEMNGTKYSSDDDFIRLAEKLDSVTDASIYLAVRTPSQWRRITGLQEPSEGMMNLHPMAGRISLYNDGMLGNESDYGTYGVREVEGRIVSERKEELVFQEKLCRRVPNGGEAMNENPYNNFDNAVKDLATMHVTYLNEGYDQTVLEKWKSTNVADKGCFKNMDGYTYIERHLGYRLLIDRVDFNHRSYMDHIKVMVTMKNVGFAPVYFEPKTELLLYDREQDVFLSYEMKGDLQMLTGGNESEKSLMIEADIPLEELWYAKYEVYFSILFPDTGQRILLANEQDMDEHGYRIGTIERTE